MSDALPPDSTPGPLPPDPDPSESRVSPPLETTAEAAATSASSLERSGVDAGGPDQLGESSAGGVSADASESGEPSPTAQVAPEASPIEPTAGPALWQHLRQSGFRPKLSELPHLWPLLVGALTHTFARFVSQPLKASWRKTRERLPLLSPSRHPRFMRYLLLLLFLLVAMLTWIERRAVLERSVQVLSWQLSTLLGEHVSFDAITLDVLNLGIEARGLTVQSNSVDETGPYLTIDGISVHLTGIPSEKLIHVADVRIVRPHVRVALAKGRLVHFPGIQALIDAAEPEPEPEPEAPGGPQPRLRIDQIVIQDARISVEDGVAGWAVWANGLNVDVRDFITPESASGDPAGTSFQEGTSEAGQAAKPSTGPNIPHPGAVVVAIQQAGVRFGSLDEQITGLVLRGDLSSEPATLSELFLKVPGAEARVEGSIYIGEPPPETARAHLSASADVDLTMLKRFLPEQAPALFGQVQVEAEADLGDSFLTRGQLTVSDVVINPFEEVPEGGFIVGEGTLDVEVTPERLRLTDAKLNLGGGILGVTGELGFSDGLPMSVKATLNKVSLGALLEHVTLDNPWMDALLVGTAEAEGTLFNPLKLNAQAALEGDDYRLYTRSFHDATANDLVLRLPRLTISSDAFIDYRAANLRGGLMETTGNRVFVDGAIGFDQTLDLSFDGVEMDVGHLSPLSGFALQGNGWAKGQIKGPLSDLVVNSKVTLFRAKFDQYALGDLNAHFLAPLNSSRFLERASRVLTAPSSVVASIDSASGQVTAQGEGGNGGGVATGVNALPSAAPLLSPPTNFPFGTDVPNLSALMPMLAEANDTCFQGELKARSPAMLLMPDFSSRLGYTVIEGPVAVVFSDPYPLLMDLTIDPTQNPKAPLNGQLTDLLDIPGWGMEGNPLRAFVRGHVRAIGPPARLNGAGNLTMVGGVAWDQPIPYGEATFQVKEGVLELLPLQLALAPVTPKAASDSKGTGSPAGKARTAPSLALNLPQTGGSGVAAAAPASDSGGDAASMALFSATEALAQASNAPEKPPNLLPEKLPDMPVVLTGTLTPDTDINAVLEFNGLSLTDIHGLETSEATGSLQGLLHLGGYIDAPTIHGQLELNKSTWRKAPLSASQLTFNTEGRTLYTEGMLLTPHVAFSAETTLNKELPFKLSADVEALDLDPYLFPVRSGTQPVTRLRLNGALKATGALLGDAPLSLDLTTRDVQFSHKGIELTMPGAQFLTLRNQQVIIPGSRLEGQDSTLSVAGTVDLKRQVDLKVLGNLNLGILDALAPGIFQRIEGQLLIGEQARRGNQAFKIGGTLESLQFDGQMQLRDAVIRTVDFPPTIDRLNGTFLLDDDEVRVESLNGYLGGGPLDGHGSMVLGPNYYPVHYDLEVHGRDAFLRYPSFLPPGVSDIDLKLAGDLESLLLSGDIYLKRMVYRERYNWEESLTDFRTYQLENLEVGDEAEDDALFNLDIRIHVPGTFYVRNNIGNVQMRAEMTLTGDTNNMYLYGDVDSVRGTVSMLDNTFDLVNGHIEFTGDYANPRLNIKMQTQIQSYTIYYQILGDLNDWQLVPGSDSGLSERDINSLIAFRTLADNITEANDARSVAAPALEFLIGRLGLLNQLQSFTMLDRFIITPATDSTGNLAARVYGEKELVQGKLFASGYYDLSFTGTQDFQGDMEWRALDCCSVILRFDNNQSLGAFSVSPGVQLKLKLEFE